MRRASRSLKAKGFGPFTGHLIGYKVIAVPRSRMRHGLQGHTHVASHLLALIKAFNPWVKAHRQVRGLDNSPTELLMAVFVFPWLWPMETVWVLFWRGRWNILE